MKLRGSHLAGLLQDEEKGSMSVDTKVERMYLLASEFPLCIYVYRYVCVSFVSSYVVFYHLIVTSKGQRPSIIIILCVTGAEFIVCHKAACELTVYPDRAVCSERVGVNAAFIIILM